MSFYVCSQPAFYAETHSRLPSKSGLTSSTTPCAAIALDPPTFRISESFIMQLSSTPRRQRRQHSVHQNFTSLALKKCQPRQPINISTYTSYIKPHQLKSKLTEMFAHSNARVPSPNRPPPPGYRVRWDFLKSRVPLHWKDFGYGNVSGICSKQKWALPD